MTEHALVNCAQLNLHSSPEELAELCKSPPLSLSVIENQFHAQLFANLVNISLQMSAAAGSDMALNTTSTPLPDWTMSPPKTIAGLSVETFAYIFLGIGGAAPVLFLIIVVISMKCYKHRKLKRLKRYQARQNVTRSLWELERKQYFKTHAKPPALDSATTPDLRNSRNQQPYLLNVNDPHASSSQSLQRGKKHRHSSSAAAPHSVMVSNSNPDVYFKETPPVNHLYERDRYPRPTHSHVKAESLPGRAQRHGGGGAKKKPQVADQVITSLDPDPTAPHQQQPRAPRSINSEEALVLQSFDKIYQDMDIETSTTNTNSSSERTSSVIKTTNSRYSIGYPQDHSISSAMPSTSRINYKADKPSRTNLNRQSVITVDLHHTHPRSSQTVISEESNSPTSGSQDSSSSSALYSTRPLLAKTRSTSSSSGSADPGKTSTISSISGSAGSGCVTPGTSGGSDQGLIGVGGGGRHVHMGYSNAAFEPADLPGEEETPDVQITRL